jgi:hypothetical protein
MLHDLTLAQLAVLSIRPDRPLVICDVDEVVVHFTRDFEDYIGARGFRLDISDLQRLSGSVRRLDTDQPVDDDQGYKLVFDFFAERTRDMQPIEGAVAGLQEIGRHADVVMLTNLPHEAGDHRRENLRNLGLPYPVITNSGPKGYAIRRMVHAVQAPVVFIDDSHSFIASAYEHAPHISLVHFLHDARFHKHAPPMDFLSLRTDTWSEVLPHVLGRLQLPLIEKLVDRA